MSVFLKHVIVYSVFLTILLTSCSSRLYSSPTNKQTQESAQSQEKTPPEINANNADMRPSIIIDSCLLYDTGRSIDTAYDDYIYQLENLGNIQSRVPSNKLPENDYESNSMEIGTQVYLERDPNRKVSYAYVKKHDNSGWVIFANQLSRNHESKFDSVDHERLFFLRIESFTLTSHGYYIDSNSDLLRTADWIEHLGIGVLAQQNILDGENLTTLPLSDTTTKAYVRKEGNIILEAYVLDDFNNRYYLFENYLSPE